MWQAAKRDVTDFSDLFGAEVFAAEVKYAGQRRMNF
jgi:hypothetical protein